MLYKNLKINFLKWNKKTNWFEYNIKTNKKMIVKTIYSCETLARVIFSF